jgi:hypothetical protein
MALPIGTRVETFYNGSKLNAWLEQNESNLEIIDIKIAYEQPYHWNQEEYSLGRLAYVVLYRHNPSHLCTCGKGPATAPAHA